MSGPSSGSLAALTGGGGAAAAVVVVVIAPKRAAAVGGTIAAREVRAIKHRRVIGEAGNVNMRELLSGKRWSSGWPQSKGRAAQPDKQAGNPIIEILRQKQHL
jgi:hypothetical protein